MAGPADIVPKVRSKVADRKARRQRDDLIRRIGELVYAQRTEPATSYDNEIATLVEKIRHLERMEELRHRQEAAGAGGS